MNILFKDVSHFLVATAFTVCTCSAFASENNPITNQRQDHQGFSVNAIQNLELDKSGEISNQASKIQAHIETLTQIYSSARFTETDIQKLQSTLQALKQDTHDFYMSVEGLKEQAPHKQNPQIAWQEYVVSAKDITQKIFDIANTNVSFSRSFGDRNPDHHSDKETMDKVSKSLKQLLKISGQNYEYLGFAHAALLEHEDAAIAFKNAALTSTVIMALSPSFKSSQRKEKYQALSSLQFHKAKYHWDLNKSSQNTEGLALSY